MLKKLFIFWIKILVRLAYALYKIEGVNAFLLILPAKLIVPTLRKYGAVIGDNVILHSPLIIHNAGDNYKNLAIGNNVYFGRAVFLDLKDKISIGNRVTISMKVTLLTHTDVGESKIRQRILPSCAPIRIGDDVYVGANATICEGVEIGELSAIGACSLVRENIASHAIVAGVPAKEIRRSNG